MEASQAQQQLLAFVVLQKWQKTITLKGIFPHKRKFRLSWWRKKSSQLFWRNSVWKVWGFLSWNFWAFWTTTIPMKERDWWFVEPKPPQKVETFLIDLFGTNQGCSLGKLVLWRKRFVSLRNVRHYRNIRVPTQGTQNEILFFDYSTGWTKFYVES